MEGRSITNDFNAAMRRFTLQMENIPADVTHPGVIEAAAEICDILRIAKMDVNLTEPKLGRVTSRPHHYEHTFRNDGEPDNDARIVLTRTTAADSVVNYYIAPYAGAEKWTDEEMKCIEDFVSSMFVFNGRARAMQICEMLTYHDMELDVYNLTFIMRKLNELIQRKEIGKYTAFRFNLKKFSIINNQIGRANGTNVMKTYIHQLNDLVGDDGYISRLGGDNFVGLCKHGKMAEVRNHLLGRSIPSGAAGLEYVTIAARTGYYKLSDELTLSTDIMDKLAMMFGMLKRNPNLQYIDYDEEVSQKAENQRWVEGNFQDALKNEEFLVYYQPKVNLKNYTLAGAEALCRWKHDGKLIPPFRFIPILEQSSNICHLDFYMLEHVCRDMRRWLDEGKSVVKVSVNISRVHLGNENLAAKIIQIINKYEIPNELIEIELTETTTDVDFTELKRVVATLHGVGISTSIDDFGIGYSSLNLIRELPWNVLKIDKSFLPNNDEKNYNQKKIMLKYVIAMAQSLGLECIVEGVETLEHVSMLKENNCFRAQGFFFDKPLPVEEFEERIINKQLMI